MFSKDRPAPTSGPGMMFASALKMMGLNPEIVEAISHGLLHDLKMVMAQQAELLARQEYFMRRANVWDDYQSERSANVRSIGSASGDSGSGDAAGAGAGSAAG